MDFSKNDKVERTLSIYTKLMNGKLINKASEAELYGVNERSIQRDIEDIRNFLELDLANTGMINSVVYDRTLKAYRLERIYQMKFTNGEILAICKILLDSRAFTKNEMVEMIDKLIKCCVPKENQKIISDMISNEEFHYVELRHRTKLIDTVWNVGQAIHNCQCIEIDYYKLKDKSIVKRKVKPVAIIFSEYYFYLTAFIDDKEVQKGFNVLNDAFPTIYRIDRIKGIKILDEKFHIPYNSRFEEGEFRKRIQFMYGGKLKKIKFKFTGLDIDSILDRLPTARIIDETDDEYIIHADVFGSGIDMWLRSQGDKVVVIN